MYVCRWVLLGCLFLGAAYGCSHVKGTDYHPLDQAGMWFGRVEELKGLGVSDAEVAELVRLKQAGVSDQTCIELVSIAHIKKHPFASSDAVISLARAGFVEPDILELTRLNQLESWNGEAVTLRLTGLSRSAVMAVARRRAAGEPVLSSIVIARLKNAQFTETQILNMIRSGVTDERAEAEITARRRKTNPTGFVRSHGRRR